MDFGKHIILLVSLSQLEIDETIYLIVYGFFLTKLPTLLQKVSYVLGKRNGYTIGFNVQLDRDPMNRGEVISKELYVNDKREGISKYFYSNGILKEEVPYVNNKRNGRALGYDEKGLLISIETYNNGFLVEREKVNRKDEKGLKQGVWRDLLC